MLHLINPSTGEYRLSVTFHDRDYHYKARLIHSEFGKELWMIWTKRKILNINYNNHTKTLTEELQHGEPALPEDFRKAMEESFTRK